jgi:hypothetical protein
MACGEQTSGLVSMMSSSTNLCAVSLLAMAISALPQTAGAADATIKLGNTAPSKSLSGVEMPLLLPGIKVNVDPHNVTPIRQIQTARFDGKSWVLFGDVLGER